MKGDEKGFTLLELLVGMVIGLLVALAVVDFFTKSNRSYLLNESRSQVQERGRFAINLLSRQVRSSMAWGCLGQNQDSVFTHLQDQASPQTEPATLTRIYSFDSSDLPNEVTSRVSPGTRVLKVAGFNDYGLRLSSHDRDSAEFGIKNTREAEFLEIKQGDYFLVIDAQCTQGHLMQASSSVDIDGFEDFKVSYSSNQTVDPGNKDEFVEFDYSSVFADFSQGEDDNYAGRLILFDASYYFISDYNGQSYLKVYRPFSDKVSRLIPGINRMRLSAGVGSKNAIDGYLTEGDVSDWDNVDWGSIRAIRLDFLITSDSGSAPGQNVSKYFDGEAFSFKDQHAEIFTLVTQVRAMGL